MAPSIKRIRSTLVNGMSRLLSGTSPKNGPCKALIVVAGVGKMIGVELGAGVTCKDGIEVVVG